MEGTVQLLRGRYAPSPTGLLHVGSARTALVAWLSARAAGGSFVLRMEDLDGKRAVPGMAQAILQDLAWLGINWDVGPDSDETYMQSRRSTLYEAAVSRLRAHERLFPCTYSRRDLERLATAPHGMPSQPPYPAALRPRQLPGDWFELHRSGKASLRFKVADELVIFQDRVYGMVCERVSDSVGDFVGKTARRCLRLSAGRSRG